MNLVKSIVLIFVSCFMSPSLAAQWQKLPFNEASDIRAIFFSSRDSGYVVGRATVFSTADGGQSWHSKHLGDGIGENFSAVHFPSKYVGYVVGKTVYKTIDGGQNWDSIYTDDERPAVDDFVSTFFSSDSQGIIVGTKIRHTMDGGLTWTIPEGYRLHQGNQVTFLDKQIGYIGGWSSDLGFDFGKLTKTTDGGKSWSTVWQDQTLVTMRINSVDFINHQIGWVAGARSGNSELYLHPNIRLYQTRNGGETWDTIATVFQNTITRIVFANEAVGFAGDVIGNLYSTADGGQSWVNDNISSNGAAINDIHIVNGVVAYATTNQGQIFKREIVASVEAVNRGDDLRVSPNPSFGWVRLTLNSSPFERHLSDVVVFDAIGGRVYRTSTAANEINIDLSSFPPGIYYIRLRSGDTYRTLQVSLL